MHFHNDGCVRDSDTIQIHCCDVNGPQWFEFDVKSIDCHLPKLVTKEHRLSTNTLGGH